MHPQVTPNALSLLFFILRLIFVLLFILFFNELCILPHGSHTVHTVENELLPFQITVLQYCAASKGITQGFGRISIPLALALVSRSNLLKTYF